MYAVCSTAGAAGTLDVVIGWVDQVGAKTFTVISALSLTSTANGSFGDVFIRGGVGATAITFSATITGGVGSPAFDIFLVLEQLG